MLESDQISAARVSDKLFPVRSYQIELSILEIYNEEIRDLLDPKTAKKLEVPRRVPPCRSLSVWLGGKGGGGLELGLVCVSVGLWGGGLSGLLVPRYLTF